MKCKYDSEADAYLIDGQPCKVDEYGDPTKHCSARKTCNQHIGRHELTCNTCITRTRSAIRKTIELSSLMLPAAIDNGVNSDSAALAAPAADPRAVADLRAYVQGHVHVWMHSAEPGRRRLTADQAWKILAALPDEDGWHPYSVLTRWQMLLSEDYGHPLPERLTIATAAAYLERNLHIIAQDPDQDFGLLYREMRKVASRLESVLHNSHAPEKGAPCPECVKAGNVDPKKVRLVREYGHWCDEDECTQQFHYDDDSGDTWHCPRNREHWWTQQGYADYERERKMGA